MIVVRWATSELELDPLEAKQTLRTGLSRIRHCLRHENLARGS